MYLLLAALALVVTGTVLYWRGVVNARHAEAEYPPLGAFICVEGCRLHYVRQGKPGTALPVVLFHGSDGFLQDFAPLLQKRFATDLDIIAFDRPGHGYSEAPPHQINTLPNQARLLRLALRELGVTRPILVGHSWGAALCLFCALESPHEVAGIVLLSPWVYPTTDPPPPLLHAARWIGSHLTYALFALQPLKRLLLRRTLEVAYFPVSVPRAYEREATALWMRSPKQIAALVQENRDAWMRLKGLSARYAQIAVPVCILTGDSDRIVHARQHAYRLHRILPHSELRIVLQTGHELPQLHPDLVLKAIEDCRKRAATLPEPYRPATPSAMLEPEKRETILRQRARELVFRYGWNATAYQILNPDILLWFTPDGAAVVGYVQHFKTRVAAGAPLCDEGRLAEVVLSFEQEAAESGERVCWFAATARLRQALAGTSHASLVIGAQPVWNPVHWLTILQKNASLRAQLNRARNKGVAVSEWSVERASGNTGLQRCLDEWLAHHMLPTLRFLTEPVTLDRLVDRRVFVAESNHTPIGFLIATPVPSRNGWLVEQIARSHEAPNGTGELLVDAAMRVLATDGFEYLTLGLVPLTQREQSAAAPPHLWLRLVLSWARLHGQRFYNFEGLDAFKAKFKPENWEPLFALTNEPHVSLRTLMAIMAAFSDGSLLWTAARALMMAARQEVVWLKQRITAKPSSK